MNFCAQYTNGHCRSLYPLRLCHTVDKCNIEPQHVCFLYVWKDCLCDWFDSYSQNMTNSSLTSTSLNEFHPELQQDLKFKIVFFHFNFSYFCGHGTDDCCKNWDQTKLSHKRDTSILSLARVCSPHVSIHFLFHLCNCTHSTAICLHQVDLSWTQLQDLHKGQQFIEIIINDETLWHDF